MLIWWLLLQTAVGVCSLRLLQIKERLKAVVYSFPNKRSKFSTPLRKSYVLFPTLGCCLIATTPTIAPRKIPLHYILLWCLGVLISAELDHL
jgi:hypothetical protein